jgi:hypothetical protein
MEELNLTQGHTYLLRYGCTDTLSEIKVLTITEKAYQVRWQSGTVTWEMKRRMDSDYSLVEDISDFPIFTDGTITTANGEPPLKFDIVWNQCHVCKGFGTVPDQGSTTGNKLCPLCFGSKMMAETVQVKS